MIGKSEPGMIPYGYMLKDDGSLNPIEADFNNNKIAMLPYSSGTTGLPKGVMLTSKNIISNICQAVHCPELKYIEEATGKFNRISDKKIRASSQTLAELLNNSFIFILFTF